MLIVVPVDVDRYSSVFVVVRRLLSLLLLVLLLLLFAGVDVDDDDVVVVFVVDAGFHDGVYIHYQRSMQLCTVQYLRTCPCPGDLDDKQ